MNKQEEQLQFARDLAKALVWSNDEYIVDTKATATKLSEMEYCKEHRTVLDIYRMLWEIESNYIECGKHKEANAIMEVRHNIKLKYDARSELI